MRWLTRALRQRMALLRDEQPDERESGAIIVIVAVLLVGGVLIGMAALSIDVGSLYAERRQLQNGADSAALAVAQDAARSCSTGSCVPTTRAQTYANSNAKDGASSVLEVCGAGLERGTRLFGSDHGGHHAVSGGAGRRHHVGAGAHRNAVRRRLHAAAHHVRPRRGRRLGRQPGLRLRPGRPRRP